MKKYFFAVMMVLFFTSISFGMNINDHVKVAPNGKGDLLIFPFYAVSAGWETKFTVINTSETDSVVAKVVIRSWRMSEELLDFPLFLSPTDGWTGSIRITDTGRVVIYSADDSVLKVATDLLDLTKTANDVWASRTDPLVKELFPVECATDSTDMGYVEVIMAGWATIPPGAKPVKKADIKARYGNVANTMNQLNPNKPPYLTGFMEFRQEMASMASGIPATVLRNYGNAIRLNLFDETRMGDAGDANNNMGEIEAAIAKNYVALPFTSNTVHLLTLPTKLTNRTIAAPCVCTGTSSTGGAFFRDATNWVNTPGVANCRVPYLMTGNDYFETLKDVDPQDPFSGGPKATARVKYLDFEVNVLRSWMADEIERGSFTEGWVQYRFIEAPLVNQVDNFTDVFTGFNTEDGTPLRFRGAPVIANALLIRSTNTATGPKDDIDLIPAAYTDFPVLDTQFCNEYRYYQYSDFNRNATLNPVACPAN